MTIRKMAAADFADGAATCDYLFDDVTLLLQTVEFTNTTNRSLGALVTDPRGVQSQFVWPALGTPPNNKKSGSGTVDISSMGLLVVAHTGISNGVQITVWSPPAGWVVGFQYPAG